MLGRKRGGRLRRDERGLGFYILQLGGIKGE